MDFCERHKKHSGMKMLRAIDRESASHINFQPTAEIAVPITWFREKGIEFYTDLDDLDQYEFAAFWLDGLSFALMHYMSSFDQSVSLLIGGIGGDRTNVAFHVSAIAEALGLSPSLFSWRENGEHVSFLPIGAASALA